MGGGGAYYTGGGAITPPYPIIVGPSYTITAQHKSNIEGASFTCVVVDLLLCKTKILAECPK